MYVGMLPSMSVYTCAHLNVSDNVGIHSGVQTCNPLRSLTGGPSPIPEKPHEWVEGGLTCLPWALAPLPAPAEN